MNWKTALRFALAETRRSGGRLYFCIFAVALGVAAVTAVRTATQSLERSIERQSRQLMGADIKLEANERLDFGTGAELTASLRAAGARDAELVEFYSMLVTRTASGAARSRLARVRAVGDAFPFYGTMQTNPPGVWDRIAGGEAALIADPALALQLGLRPGQRVRLGEREFIYRGSFVKKPGAPASGFGYAPAVYIARSELEATGLVQTGSRIRWSRLFQTPENFDAAAWKEANWNRASNAYIQIESYREAAAGLQRFLNRLAGFLSITGLITLLLGGLGIGAALSVFIKERLDHAAIYRSLGASANDVFRIYFLLAMLLGGAGSLLGLLPGALFSYALKAVADTDLVQNLLPIELTIEFSWRACFEGGAAGLVATLLFTLLPVYRIRRASPLRVLRKSDEDAPLKLSDYAFYAAVGLATVAFVLVITSAQTGSFVAAFWFALSIAAAAAALGGLAFGIMRGVRAILPKIRNYHMRQGAANLYRPGNQTLSAISAVGLGVLLLGAVFILEASLQGEIAINQRSDTANVFIVDIQSEQKPELERLLRDATGVSEIEFAPIVTARLKAINGAAIEPAAIERDAVQRTWQDNARTREYMLSYRDHTVPWERVTSGRFWQGTPPEQEVSVTEDWAETLNVGLNDQVVFDIQGLPLTAKITSLREADWSSMRPNTMVLFSPGLIESAPHTFVASLRVERPEDIPLLQDRIAAQFSNISIIDLTEAVGQLGAILGSVSAVIRFLAALTILNGIVILAGAISAGRFARLREAMLLKVLGASRADLNRILLAEYGLLAVFGVAAGLALATLATEPLLTFVFRTAAAFPAMALGLTAAGVIILNTAIGFFISRDVARARPLSVLRDE